MKSILKLSVTLILLLGLTAFGLKSYFGAKFMSASDAEKKWGRVSFDAENFKSHVDLTKRAPMAVDLIKKKKYVGQPMKQVREDLGTPDSYFFSDTIYAYKIMPFPGENTENWHLVFIPDENLEKVKEVKIHKKCCYMMPFK